MVFKIVFYREKKKTNEKSQQKLIKKCRESIIAFVGDKLHDIF